MASNRAVRSASQMGRTSTQDGHAGRHQRHSVVVGSGCQWRMLRDSRRGRGGRRRLQRRRPLRQPRLACGKTVGHRRPPLPPPPRQAQTVARDGKPGKLQVVIGLLCDADGVPLSIEVFAGNTCDLATVASQIAKAAGRFGAGPGDVTFVGDRGMLKSRQVEDVTQHGFHCITAIAKPQIRALLDQGLIQMNLFDQELAEVTADDGLRYIIRRNPEWPPCEPHGTTSSPACANWPTSRPVTWPPPLAHAEAAVRTVEQKREQLKLSGWVTVSAAGLPTAGPARGQSDRPASRRVRGPACGSPAARGSAASHAPQPCWCGRPARRGRGSCSGCGQSACRRPAGRGRF